MTAKPCSIVIQFQHLTVRACFGPQLWVPNVVTTWLRHLVVTWCRRHAVCEVVKKVSQECFHACDHTTWSKTSSRIHCKKSTTTTMWDRTNQNKKQKNFVFGENEGLSFAVRHRSQIGHFFFHLFFFCTRCKSQFGNHFTTTCGNFFVTSLLVLG